MRYFYQVKKQEPGMKFRKLKVHNGQSVACQAGTSTRPSLGPTGQGAGKLHATRDLQQDENKGVRDVSSSLFGQAPHKSTYCDAASSIFTSAVAVLEDKGDKGTGTRALQVGAGLRDGKMPVDCSVGPEGTHCTQRTVRQFWGSIQVLAQTQDRGTWLISSDERFPLRLQVLQKLQPRRQTMTVTESCSAFKQQNINLIQILRPNYCSTLTHQGDAPFLGFRFRRWISEETDLRTKESSPSLPLLLVIEYFTTWPKSGFYCCCCWHSVSSGQKPWGGGLPL